MSINRVFVSGNITREPELRSTSGGVQVLSFGLAVNEDKLNRATGEYESHPNYIDCTMFGKYAEAMSRYLSKGTRVAIEGKLRYSSWESNGQKRSKLDVVVSEVIPMQQRADGGNRADRAPQGAQPPLYDEDIPF